MPRSNACPPGPQAPAAHLATHAATALLVGLLLVAVAPPRERTALQPAEPVACDPDRITLHIQLNESDLQRGGPRAGLTHLHIQVDGTRSPVAVELINRTPGVVEIEGGVVQVVHSSGGPHNHLERELATLRAGDFQIRYRLGDRPCPLG